MRSQTLTSRVVLGTVVAASLAAIISASSAAGLSGWLVTRAEDERLRGAARILADELDAEEGSAAEVVAQETSETNHLGLVVAVFDAKERVAGDARLPRLPPASCQSIRGPGLRVCSVTSRGGLEVEAASASSEVSWLLAAAAIAAAILAAAFGWAVSRSVARAAIGPLTRLEQRLGALEKLDSRVDLGTSEGVDEVDRLRTTLENLLARLLAALAHAERFAADAAHELRTPLTAVRAELELLAEQGSSQSKDLQRARDTLGRLETLVERLLVLATPARGRAEADEALSLRDVLEDTVLALPLAERQRVSIGEGDVVVRGDSALLQVLFSNALSNALKFGNVARVSVARQGREALVCVEDDGPGIPEAERGLVFEPFFSSPEARRKGKAGHGLGLAIIAHIARRHRGSAHFGAGARLEIRLAAEASS